MEDHPPSSSENKTASDCAKSPESAGAFQGDFTAFWVERNCRKVMRLLAVVTILFLVNTPIQAETIGPENGVLYIHGGGALNIPEFVNLAKKASNKDHPAICVITTPQGKRRAADYNRGIPFRIVATLKERFGLKQVTELYTLSRAEANLPEFYGLVDEADAVFMSGGNQCFLTDAFLGTKTLEALYRLLDRGGVISGSSAGAQVQSSFMTRGDYTGRIILGDKQHQIGFGFVKNAAFDVHVQERGRERDLLQLFQANPKQLQEKGLNPLELLGIGIDQGTAITVIKNSFRVSGKGQVYIFDPLIWGESPRKWTYQTIPSGTTYNMQTREVVDP